MSSRALCPGSIYRLAPAFVDRWIPRTSTGMTSPAAALGVHLGGALVEVAADHADEVLDLVLEEVVGVGHHGVLDFDALLYLGLDRQLSHRGRGHDAVLVAVHH